MDTQVDKIAYRIDEACKTCGLSRSFIYEKLKDHSLKSIKVGGRRLILKADLIDFISTSAATPSDSAY